MLEMCFKTCSETTPRSKSVFYPGSSRTVPCTTSNFTHNKLGLTGWASLVANEWEGSESPTSRLRGCSCWQIPSRSPPTSSWPTVYWEIWKYKDANSVDALKFEEFISDRLVTTTINRQRGALLPGKDSVLNAFLLSILHRLHLCPPTREVKQLLLNFSGNIN